MKTKIIQKTVQKAILITGLTDGIGLEIAKMLASQGHCALLHGRNFAKLEPVKSTFSDSGGRVESYVAD